MGINLGDPIFEGIYRGKQAHPADLDDVVKRAVDIGCEKMMVTGSDLDESAKAVKLAERYRMLLFSAFFFLSSLPFWAWERRVSKVSKLFLSSAQKAKRHGSNSGC